MHLTSGIFFLQTCCSISILWREEDLGDRWWRKIGPKGPAIYIYLTTLSRKLVRRQSKRAFLIGCAPFEILSAHKGNQMLLSLGQILMQTIFAPIILKYFLAEVFLFDAKEYIFVLRNFKILHKLKKEDNLNSSRYLHMLDQCQHLLSQTKWS